MALVIVPIRQKAAFAYVAKHHRHHQPPRGSVLCVAVAEGDSVRGVAIVGRPSSRMLDDGWTLEVTRCCTDGAKNACSMLYAASWRAARALGYRKVITYTLPSEGGASLRGAGWRCIGEAGGGSWSRKDRPRVDMHPLQVKMRWDVA